MTDPTRAMPTAGVPSNPSGDPNRRLKVAIGVVGAMLVVLVAALFLIGDDDGPETATGDTTSTTESAPSTTPTTTTPSTTTTSSTTSSTTTTSTTTTSTTSTTTPPDTVPPAQCTGDQAPDDPEPHAEIFYEAWTLDDRGCANGVATTDAVSRLFDDADGEGAAWIFQGCTPLEEPDPYIDCAYSYEGGAAHFHTNYSPLGGWQIFDVSYFAD